MSAASLPFDILSLVAEQLTWEDQLSCLLVCRSWHWLFMRVLYRNVDGARLDYKHLRRILRKHASAVNPLGQFVRGLKLQDTFLKRTELEELRALCPHIRSLHFWWQDTDEHKERVKEDGRNTTTRRSNRTQPYFGTPCVMLETWAIVELTLERQEGSKQRIVSSLASAIRSPNVERHYLVPYLVCGQNLRRLTLQNVIPILLTGYLDIIHDACPNLIYLRVIPGPEKVQYLTYREMRRTEERDAQERRDQRCPVMLEELYINCAVNISMEVMDFWLTYIATRYPELKKLEITAMHSLGHRVLNSFSRPQETACRLFSENCKKLESINIENVSLSFALFAMLVANAHYLQNARYNSDFQIHGRFESRELSVALKKLPSGLKNLNFGIAMLETIDMAALDVRPSLTTLTLTQRALSAHRPIKFSMHDIFTCFPNLDTLVTNNIDMDMAPEEDERITYRLKTLRLYNTHISNQLYLYISRHLPLLRILSLHRCGFYNEPPNDNEKNTYNIFLPSHHFDTIEICSPFLISQSQSAVSERISRDSMNVFSIRLLESDSQPQSYKPSSRIARSGTVNRLASWYKCTHYLPTPELCWDDEGDLYEHLPLAVSKNVCRKIGTGLVNSLCDSIPSINDKDPIKPPGAHGRALSSWLHSIRRQGYVNVCFANVQSLRICSIEFVRSGKLLL